jgi:hypothetical protein
VAGLGILKRCPTSSAPVCQSFDDVIQVELEFLHRHAKMAD